MADTTSNDATQTTCQVIQQYVTRGDTKVAVAPALAKRAITADSAKSAAKTTGALKLKAADGTVKSFDGSAAVDLSDSGVYSAQRAKEDAGGNVIVDTYATKTALENQKVTVTAETQATNSYDIATIKVGGSTYKLVGRDTPYSHPTSGITAGTYRSVTVNAQGHVTGGTNPTTLAGYGITDAKIADGVITLGENTVTPITPSTLISSIEAASPLSIAITGNAATATKATNADNAAVATKLTTANHGSATKLWYLDKGVPTDSDGTVGSATKPVYLSGGSISETTYTLGDACAKSVAGEVTSAGTGLPTAKAVYDFVTSQLTGSYKVMGSCTAEQAATAATSKKMVIGGVSTDLKVGFVYNLSSQGSISILGETATLVPLGANLVWTEQGWDKLSEMMDISGAISTSIPAGTAGQLLQATGTAGTAQLATENVGADNQPVYISAGKLVATTANVGANANFMYMAAGKLTKSTATLGNATKPIYLDAGTFKEGTALSAAAYKGVITTGAGVISSATDLPTGGAVATAISTKAEAMLRYSGKDTEGSAISGAVAVVDFEFTGESISLA